VPRALYQPNEERVKGDRRVLVGIHPVKLEFRFASRNIWSEANPGQSTFCRAAKWNVNEIHGTEETKLVRESWGLYPSCGRSVAQRCASEEILHRVISLICFRSSGFRVTLRRGSCVDDPPICFCVSSNDRSSGQSIRCWYGGSEQRHPPKWVPGFAVGDLDSP
jgi:hypothetical protein